MSNATNTDGKPSKWVPLEANPEVFNAWSTPIGLPPTLSFTDLYSLDPDFLQFTPQPVLAVLLLFPSVGQLARERKEEDERGKGKWVGEGDGKGEGEGVWWIKQTVRIIGNACGSIGLLHSLLNLPPTGPHSLSPTSPLIQFRTQSLPLSPLDRAKLLDETTFFEEAHEKASGTGQSTVPVTQEERETDFHFISFVKAKGKDGKDHIVELDGGRTGPVDQGVCSEFLRDTAKVIQTKYIDRAEGDLNFNMIVLAAKGDDE